MAVRTGKHVKSYAPMTRSGKSFNSRKPVKPVQPSRMIGGRGRQGKSRRRVDIGSCMTGAVIELLFGLGIQMEDLMFV